MIKDISFYIQILGSAAMPFKNPLRSIIGLLAIVMFCKCTKNAEIPNIPTITISPDYINNPSETYDSLFKSVSYNPLETGKEFLISKISQLHITDSDIFILDEVQSQLFRFSAEGKFKNRIGRKGKGPGEYLNPTYFFVDENQKKIKICDRRQKKIIIYDFAGKYIKELCTSLYFDVFFNDVNEGYWAFIDDYGNSINESEKLNFIKIDSIGKSCDQILGIEKYNTQISNFSHISNHKIGNSVSFVLPFKNNIYSFNCVDSVSIRYHLDFQNTTIPENELLRISGSTSANAAKNQKIAAELMKEYAIGYFGYIEIDDWIYFGYSYKKNGCGVFYNKNRKFTYDFTKVPYDKNGWGTLFPLLFGKGSTFYAASDPYIFKTQLEKSQHLYTKERLESMSNLLNDIKVESNPIIIKYEL